MTTQSSSTSRLESLKQVINGLRAYSITFGLPDDELERRAVVGAIAATLTSVSVENSRLERFIDEAIATYHAAYNSLGTSTLEAEASLVDASAQLLAEAASIWLDRQGAIVSNVMNAYVQQFVSEDRDWQTSDTIELAQTTIATLNDGSLSRSGSQELVRRVIASFDIDQALSCWVAPEWIAPAQRIASYTIKGNSQSELQSIAWEYVQQFQSILSPQLIEQILKEGAMDTSSKFTVYDLGFSQMLYYKFQLLETDLVTTKSHKQIEARVHKAVEDFKEHTKTNTNVTRGISAGDLQVSSPFFSALITSNA